MLLNIDLHQAPCRPLHRDAMVPFTLPTPCYSLYCSVMAGVRVFFHSISPLFLTLFGELSSIVPFIEGGLGLPCYITRKLFTWNVGGGGRGMRGHS